MTILFLVCTFMSDKMPFLICGLLVGPHEPGDGLGGRGLFCFFKAHSCLSTIKAVTYIASAFASIPDLLLLLWRLNFCFWQVVFFSL